MVKPTATEGNYKKPTTRYFDAPTVGGNETEAIKLKGITKRKFEGDEISFDSKPSFKPKKSGKKNPFLNDMRAHKPKIPQKTLQKYSRGDSVQTKGVRTKFFKEQQQRKEIQLQYATEQAARAEILLTEEAGFVEPDEDEITSDFRQDQLVKHVDILSATKRFELHLDDGPYSMRYTTNGRHLLLGGQGGHVAALDWHTKKLKCEMNVQETVTDVAWLHVDTMFACAQKNWVYIYDHQGTELHCIKRQFNVERMEFLPYHFLLATSNANGYLTWLDTSIGEFAGNFNAHMGSIRVMQHNPGNGVLCIGGGNGVVSMWSPKVREPLAKMLCHSAPLSAITVDPRGQYMVTAGIEGRVKVWDVRTLSGPLVTYRLHKPATHVEVSQRGVLAISQGNYVAMYQSLLQGKKKKTLPYLQHTFDSWVHCMRFCPYEDVLGAGTGTGFSSLLVPGSGEPNFDAYEANPFQTKSQRREREVHALLRKVPADLITLDPNAIAAVDEPTLQEKVAAKSALFHLKPPQIDINSKRRNKMKGRGGTAQAARSKQIVKDTKRREFIAEVRAAKREVIEEHRVRNEDYLPLAVGDGGEDGGGSKKSVLDRFKPKKRKTPATAAL